MPQTMAMTTIAEVLEDADTLTASHSINDEKERRATLTSSKRWRNGVRGTKDKTATYDPCSGVAKDVMQLEEEVEYLYRIVQEVAPLQARVQALERQSEAIRSHLSHSLPLHGRDDIGVDIVEGHTITDEKRSDVDRLSLPAGLAADRLHP